MANMMAGIRLEGAADSGYGVRLVGFHVQMPDFPSRLDALSKSTSVFECAQAENNGWITFLAQEWRPVEETENFDGPKKIAVFRREPHRFFLDLGEFLKKTRACFVDQILLSDSLGSVTLTMVYRQIPEAGESV